MSARGATRARVPAASRTTNNKAADTQGRAALIEDKRPFKAEEAVVEALRTVLQINILAVG